MENNNRRKKALLAVAVLLGLAIVGGVLLHKAGNVTDDAANVTSAPGNAEATGGNETATQTTDASATPNGSSSSANGVSNSASNGASNSGSSASATTAAAAGASAGSVGAGAAGSTPGGLGGFKNKILGFFGAGAANQARTGANDLGSAAPGGAGLAIRTGEGGMPAGGASAQALKPSEPTIDVSKNCFTETFTQKTNMSVEALANRRNLLRLKYAEVNPKAVCVRVNGTPVAYQLRPSENGGKVDEIMLGPVAAPTAKITVRYCMVKTTCGEDCNVPKDEFLEAIGGVADAGDSLEGGKNTKWDPEEQGGEDDVAASLDPEVKRELANHAEMKTFDGWLSDGAEVSCGTKPLPKPVAGTTASQPQS